MFWSDHAATHGKQTVGLPCYLTRYDTIIVFCWVFGWVELSLSLYTETDFINVHNWQKTLNAVVIAKELSFKLRKKDKHMEPEHLNTTHNRLA